MVSMCLLKHAVRKGSLERVTRLSLHRLVSVQREARATQARCAVAAAASGVAMLGTVTGLSSEHARGGAGVGHHHRPAA